MSTVRVGTPEHRESQTSYWNAVSSEYFRLMRIPLVRGRTFTSEEAMAEAAVAVVSETAARSLRPGADPMGRTLTITTDGGHGGGPRFTRAAVIGVSKDIVCQAMEGRGRPVVHFPSSTHSGSMILLLRGKGDPEQTRRLLEAALSHTPAANEGVRIVALQEAVDLGTYPQRAASWLSSLLGGFALLLTLTGMYGVVSYLVRQRTREIGIRLALGATRAQVVRFVLSYSTRLAAIGVGLGAFLALVLSKYFASTLGTMINVYDFTAYSLSVAVVLLAAVVAALGPALRSCMLDPLDTLRSE